jgi:hypothetical protein
MHEAGKKTVTSMLGIVGSDLVRTESVVKVSSKHNKSLEQSPWRPVGTGSLDP